MPVRARPFADLVKDLLDAAETRVGRGVFDGVVFPELAMTEQELNELSSVIVNPARFLISGVGASAQRGRRGENKAIWDTPFRLFGDVMKARFEQSKHHRWKITKPQIVQYGIGTGLHPEANWWESISVGPRTIAFATLRRWLTISVLICEDLARPEIRWVMCSGQSDRT